MVYHMESPMKSMGDGWHGGKRAGGSTYIRSYMTDPYSVCLRGLYTHHRGAGHVAYLSIGVTHRLYLPEAEACAVQYLRQGHQVVAYGSGHIAYYGRSPAEEGVPANRDPQDEEEQPCAEGLHAYTYSYLGVSLW